MALLMWVNLSGRLEGEDNRVVRIFSNVALVQQGVPENMKLSSEIYQISVSLSGRESEMREISANDIDVRLDLSEYVSGTYNIPLSLNNVTVRGQFESISVEEIQPRIVRLTLERKLKKNVRVVLSTRGHPDLDYELVALEVTPRDAIIEGPESQVAELSILVAEPIDIDGSKADISGRVRFDFDKQIPHDASVLNLNELVYTATIREIVETRTIPERYQVEIKAGDGKFKVKPGKVKAKITGPVSRLSLINQAWLKPFIVVGSEVKKGDSLVLQTELLLPEDESERDQVSALIAAIQLEWEPAEVVIE